MARCGGGRMRRNYPLHLARRLPATERLFTLPCFDLSKYGDYPVERYFQ